MSKIILVTGANKGIGFEITRQLLKQNHTVILTARHERRGVEAIDRLKQEGLSASFLKLDVTASDQWRDVHQQIKNEFGRIDVLINNAAVLLKDDQSLLRNSNETTQATIATDALAPLNVVREFRSLIPTGGRIINISSGGGSMSDPVGGWSPAYCISKSLLNAITRHLANELRGEISVNAVCPGWVQTDMGGKSAPRSVERGADTAVWLATTDRIESGKFYRDRKVIPW